MWTKFTEKARAQYKTRDERVENMTDEGVETYYSCTLCQSFAPSHVCVVSPERTGLCGAYNWFDCKASFEINPTGPNQPIEKGECLDPVAGQLEGRQRLRLQGLAPEGRKLQLLLHRQ
jgi:acetyl-CoA synthase